MTVKETNKRLPENKWKLCFFSDLSQEGSEAQHNTQPTVMSGFYSDQTDFLGHHLWH